MRLSSSINPSELFYIVRNSIENELNITEIKTKNNNTEKLKRLEKKYSKKQGAFVTLTINGKLRGCIGYILPIYPLFKTLTLCAKAAAFEDSRFNPLTLEEYKQIVIEISLLSIPELLKNVPINQIPSQITIGRHGLIIRKGGYCGLLLPQVFAEYKVNPIQALEMTCEKAGLPSLSWKSPQCKIEIFSATIYSEKMK